MGKTNDTRYASFDKIDSEQLAIRNFLYCLIFINYKHLSRNDLQPSTKTELFWQQLNKSVASETA